MRRTTRDGPRRKATTCRKSRPFGFSPSAVRAVYHWHHGIEEEAVDVNFAIHFRFWDMLFGTFHMPPGKRPSGCGIPEKMPQGYLRQLAYPFVRS